MPNIRRIVPIVSAAGILAAAVWIGGAADAQQKRALKELAAQAERSNEQTSFRIGQMNAQPQLAIELEFGPDGVRTVGSTVVRAPRKSNAAVADYRVRALAGARTLAEFVIADPTVVEVDGEGLRQSEQPQTVFIYVPLDAEMTELAIAPVEGRERFTMLKQERRLEARPLLEQGCRDKEGMAECRQTLERLRQ